MNENSIEELCSSFVYSDNVTALFFASNKIQRLCPSFIQSVIYRRNIEEMDLSKNMLSIIPSELQKVKNTKILLAKNPVLCNCDMLWMISWLSNSTLTSGEHLVPDYKNVTCSNGEFRGKPIYKLNADDMGCHHEVIATWEIILLVIVGVVILAICIIIFLFYRRWNEFKFWSYKHFFNKENEEESLEGIHFDCLVSYRYVTKSFSVLSGNRGHV